MKAKSENPLLAYHLFVFTRNRWRRQPLLYGAAAFGIALSYFFLFMLIATYEASLVVPLTIALLAICFAAPLMAYNLFSLEYEKHTWESLALTRLTAREILWGKWGVVLTRVAGLTLLFLPMLLVSEADSISAYAVIAGLLLVFSWGALLVSFGMWLSFKLKRTLSTASALYAGQVLVLLLTPVLYTLFTNNQARDVMPIYLVQSHSEAVWWWIFSFLHLRFLVDLNPFTTLLELSYLRDIYTFAYYDPYSERALYPYGLLYLKWGFTQSAFYLLLAALFAGLTYRGLKIAWRK